MPSCASSRPTELALNTTPNLSLISFATMARVHSAKANFSCNGFFCVMVLYSSVTGQVRGPKVSRKYDNHQLALLNTIQDSPQKDLGSLDNFRRYGHEGTS